MLEDVKIKYYKKNKLLFSKDSICLQELLELIKKQNHRTLIIWSLKCANETVSHLENNETINEALTLSKEWAEGKIKMPIAKKAILKVHALAKLTNNPVDIALYHAIGHACATIHVETHAIGLPIYELTSIVHKYGIDNCKDQIEEKIVYYIKNLIDSKKYLQNHSQDWAPFLLKDKHIL